MADNILLNTLIKGAKGVIFDGNEDDYMVGKLLNDIEFNFEKKGKNKKKLKNWPQQLATNIASLAMLAAGTCAGFTPYISELHEGMEVYMPTLKEHIMFLLIDIGMIPGTFLGALIAHCVGRKFAIILSMVFFVSAWILVIYDFTVNTLILVNFMFGIGIGMAFLAVPMYVSEISSSSVRGRLSLEPFLYFFVGLLAQLINYSESAYTTAAVSLTVPVITICFMLYLPETPFFYAMRSNMQSATKSLNFFKRYTDNNEELEDIATFSNIYKCIQVRSLFESKWNKKALHVVLLLFTLSELTGSQVLQLHVIQEAFTRHGLAWSSMHKIIHNISNWSMAVSIFFIDRLGRKPVLIVSCILTPISLFLMGLTVSFEGDPVIPYPDTFIVVFLFMYQFSFNFGMYTIPFLLLNEVFTPRLKALASCIALVYYYIVQLVIQYGYEILFKYAGTYFYFIPVLSCLIGLVLILVYLPETKNTSLLISQNIFNEDTNVNDVYREIKKK